MKESKKKKNPLNDYARYSSLGIQMLVIIGAGTFGGFMMDEWLGLRFPVFLILLSLFSVSVAIYFAIKEFGS